MRRHVGPSSDDLPSQRRYPCSISGTGIRVGRYSVPCSGFAELVGTEGGSASARGPHENPINDHADLVESKFMDSDERKTLSQKQGQDLAE